MHRGAPRGSPSPGHGGYPGPFPHAPEGRTAPSPNLPMAPHAPPPPRAPRPCAGAAAAGAVRPRGQCAVAVASHDPAPPLPPPPQRPPRAVIDTTRSQQDPPPPPHAVPPTPSGRCTTPPGPPPRRLRGQTCHERPAPKRVLSTSGPRIETPLSNTRPPHHRNSVGTCCVQRVAQ